MSKILITGANGQLGRAVTKMYNLISKDDLLLTDHSQLDITSLDKVYKFVTENRPNTIINCAAHTKVDLCEEEEDSAFRINSIGPKNLAQAAYSIGAEIVQISTDYVFDGTAKKPLKEFDITNPMTVYGKSKLQGENFVRSLNPRHYIIRTAWLYGDGNNFVQTMLKLSETKSELKVVSDQFGTPTSTDDVSNIIFKLVNEKNYGTFHGTCNGDATWYDFAFEIFKQKGITIDLIPCKTEEFPRPAKRPAYSVLDNYMLRQTTGDTARHWQDALREYLKRI